MKSGTSCARLPIQDAQTAQQLLVGYLGRPRNPHQQMKVVRHHGIRVHLDTGKVRHPPQQADELVALALVQQERLMGNPTDDMVCASRLDHTFLSHE
jgi:hypothetical protein